MASSKTAWSGPNRISIDHFKQAVELARSCIPEEAGKLHPKVGAVIVNKGEVITSAFRGEIGRGDHAEFIALERKGRDDGRIEGADLITTLEPCTTRSHDKRPCASWIVSRRIRKVWIATLDYNPAIAGRGELLLQKAGIFIGRFPDELTSEVVCMNQDFLSYIESRQPQIPIDEQRFQRNIVLDALREDIRQRAAERDSILRPWVSGILSKRESREAEEIVRETTERIRKLEQAMNQAFFLEFDSAGSWLQLGEVVLKMGQFGLAGLAFQVAGQIDATRPYAWTGQAQAEVGLNRQNRTWPFHFQTEIMDKSPEQKRSRAWLREQEYEDDIVVRLKMTLRAAQLGNSSEELVQVIGELLKQSDPNEKDRKIEAAMVWWHLGKAMDILEEEDVARGCYTKLDELVLGPDYEEKIKQLQELLRKRQKADEPI